MNTKKLNKILADINAQLELKDCLNSSVENVTGLLSTEIVSLMLLNNDSRELSIKAARGLDDSIIKRARLRLGEGISGWVAENRKSLLIKDIKKDKRFNGWGGKYNNDSLLSVPLIAKDKVIGVINVTNKISKGILQKSDLNSLEEALPHISIAIYKALKYEEAKRLSQLKLDFISVVSHELRIPLAAIKESVSLMHERLAGEINEKQERFLQLSLNNVERITRLIDGLLDMSKMEVGRFEMKRTLQDICDVLKQVFDTLKINADSKNIIFKLSAPSQSLDMWFDIDQITRVFMNVIGNALKFTQRSGSVDVKLEDLDRFVRVTITDNGPGIAKDDLEKVFDKFYSVIKSGTTEVKGTGLGLPISKEIVELHGGNIIAKSEECQGAKFTITLPKDMRLVRKLGLEFPD
ncbi:MAG: GAF domain-containing sensor histidine kinase [Candidatus Omnitrophota bacterium]